MSLEKEIEELEKAVQEEELQPTEPQEEEKKDGNEVIDEGEGTYSEPSEEDGEQEPAQEGLQEEVKKPQDYYAERQNKNTDKELLNRLDQIERYLKPDEEEEDPTDGMTEQELIKYRLEQALQKIEKIEKQAQLTEAEQRTKSLFSNAKEEVRSHENSFKATRKDYDEALNFALERERKLLKFNNPQMTESEIVETLERGKIFLAAKALKLGKNPAQHIYDFALTVGYNPKQSNTAIREAQKQITKPNAMTGGGGRGANAAPKEIGEYTEAEIEAMTNEEAAKLLSKQF